MRIRDEKGKYLLVPTIIINRKTHSEIVLKDTWGREKARAKISNEDAERVSKHRWMLNNQGYVRIASSEKRTLLHRYIMEPPKGYVIDHKNHDPLDNRRSNLRLCTPKENARYARPRPSKHSKYKGVTYDEKKKLYRARISINHKRIGLGRFKCQKEAALAYDAAAKEYHGEFAYLNQFHFKEDFQ